MRLVGFSERIPEQTKKADYEYMNNSIKRKLEPRLSGQSSGLVTGSIPGHGTCLGCGPGPQLGVYERKSIDVSLTHGGFSPSLPPSLPFSLKINKYNL